MANTNSLKDAFEQTARDNVWGDPESLSGRGSNLFQTKIIREKIPQILEKYKVRKFLDAPCGDVFWIRELFPLFTKNKITYIGADIVPSLIEQNKKLASGNINFENIDLTVGPVPTVDLIMTRDCFIHLSFKNILSILRNYKKSGSKYLLVSTYTDQDRKNIDVDNFYITGRMLNLQKFPFYFSTPLELIVEGCTEDDGKYSDKSFALWELSKINLSGLRFRIALVNYQNKFSHTLLRAKSLHKRIMSKLRRTFKI